MLRYGLIGTLREGADMFVGMLGRNIGDDHPDEAMALLSHTSRLMTHFEGTDSYLSAEDIRSIFRDLDRTDTLLRVDFHRPGDSYGRRVSRARDRAVSLLENQILGHIEEIDEGYTGAGKLAFDVLNDGFDYGYSNVQGETARGVSSIGDRLFHYLFEDGLSSVEEAFQEAHLISGIGSISSFSKGCQYVGYALQLNSKFGAGKSDVGQNYALTALGVYGSLVDAAIEEGGKEMLTKLILYKPALGDLIPKNMQMAEIRALYDVIERKINDNLPSE